VISFVFGLTFYLRAPDSFNYGIGLVPKQQISIVPIPRTRLVDNFTLTAAIWILITPNFSLAAFFASF
jgi:hypothetical protein